jgi:transcriptional regulator with XRE-family HTH domain
MNIFGQKLRKLREDKGLTQQQLAEKVGYVLPIAIFLMLRKGFLSLQKRN